MSFFFTSDTHFGHRSIIDKFIFRPFKDADAMDDALVQRWNEVVSPGDQVYHLGDVSFRSAEATAAILARLNGRITIVAGNHDSSGHLRKWEKAGLITGFARRYHVFEPFILSHVPMWTHEPLLCGHVHMEWKQQRRTINVGVDQWDYRPVALEVLLGLAGLMPPKMPTKNAGFGG